MVQRQRPKVCVFGSLRPFGSSPTIAHYLQSTVITLGNATGAVILVSPIRRIPVRLRGRIMILSFPVPSVKRLGRILSARLGQTEGNDLAARSQRGLLGTTLNLAHSRTRGICHGTQIVSGGLATRRMSVILSRGGRLVHHGNVLRFVSMSRAVSSINNLRRLGR